MIVKPLKLITRPLSILTIIVLSCLGCSGCQKSESTPNSVEKPAVLTTVDPMAFILQKVTQSSEKTIDILTLVPAGKEPETFTPSPSTVAQLSGCSIFFRMGLPCEDSLLPRLTAMNPDIQIVDLRDFIPDSLKTANLDPHLWMSPAVVKEVLRGILPILSAQFPEQAELLAQNTQNLTEELTVLEQEIAEKLAGLSNRTLYVFHPAYGYFCHQFGLKQEAMEKGGHDPSPKDVADWIRRIAAEGIQTIIAQPEFGDAQLRAVADSVQVNIEIHSPLEPDYFKNLRQLTDFIAHSTPEKESSEEN